MVLYTQVSLLLASCLFCSSSPSSAPPSENNNSECGGQKPSQSYTRVKVLMHDTGGGLGGHVSINSQKL